MRIWFILFLHPIKNGVFILVEVYILFQLLDELIELNFEWTCVLKASAHSFKRLLHGF